MESTGVYWRPVFNLLEADHDIICWSMPSTSRPFPGARPMSRTPNGWPTCCAMGCCAPASFRRAASATLRELTRYRQTLVQERTQEVNRLHKLLERREHQAGRGGDRRAGQERA